MLLAILSVWKPEWTLKAFDKRLSPEVLEKTAAWLGSHAHDLPGLDVVAQKMVRCFSQSFSTTIWLFRTKTMPYERGVNK